MEFEWISVDERLPGANCGCVLVWKRDLNHPDMAWFISHKEGYYFCIGYDVKQTYEPDYWMPIPPTPEKIIRKVKHD